MVVPPRADLQETSGEKGLIGKAALLSPVQVARLCPTPGLLPPKPVQPVQRPWFRAQSHHRGNRDEGGQMGRARAEAPLAPILAGVPTPSG